MNLPARQTPTTAKWFVAGLIGATPFEFVPLAEASFVRRAEPVFVDIEPRTPLLA